MNLLRRSLRTKIAAAILLASLLPFLAVVWLLARAGEANLRSAAQARAQTAGAVARSLAEERADRLLAQAQAIALTPGLGAAVAARDRPTILALTRAWTDNLRGATLAVTDERGVMVLRTYAPDRYGDDMTATTKGLLPALRGEPASSTEAAGLRGLAIRGFGPIRHEGRLVGIAAVTQNLDQEFLAGLRSAIGYDTFAVFPDGATVGPAPAEATAAAIAGQRAEYTGLTGSGADERAVHAWPLTDPDGTVIAFLGVLFPLDDLAAAQAQVRTGATAAGLLALLASGLLAWQLSRAMIRPIEGLTGAARGIAGGAPAAIPAVRTGDELEELGAALATMVATLSDQARRLAELNAGLAAERGRAQALAEASRAFAEARLDVQAVLDAVARRVAELLDGGCVVRELSADGKWLTPVAFHHTDPEALAFWREMFSAPHRADEGVNARAVKTGQTQFHPRLTPEEARATVLPEHWPFLERFGIHSLLVVPLRVGGGAIGTLAAQRTVPDRPFVEEDADFLRDLADRAALAIENARLYREVQQRVEEQIGLNSALREVAEARDRALAEAEARRAHLHALFAQAPAAIAETRGPEHEYVFANPRYLRLVGRRDPAELLDRPVREALPELEAQGYVELLDRIYQTGEPWVGHEVPIQLEREGEGGPEEAFINAVVQPVRDTDGQIVGLQAYALEVTDLVRARRGVEAERALMETVVRQMPAGVIIAEAPSGRLILGNDLVEQVWRQPFVASASIDEYAEYQGFHPDGRPYRPQEWPLARSLQAGEVVVAEEIEILRGDGSRGTILVSSAPIRDPEGRITAAVATFHDVTERRELEQSLRRSELRFRTIIEQFPLSTQILAPDGSTLMVNRAWEQLWGVTLEQIKGYNVLEDRQLVEKGIAPHIQRAFAGTPSEVPAIRYEPELSVPDVGAVPYRWVRAFAFPVKEESGALREVVLIHEDVTERQLAEEARAAALVEAQAQRDEAERARGSLQTFLGLVAHDLRGPISTIQGHVQLLRRRIESMAPERRTQALQAIEAETRRMNGMIGSLVDAARIGAGQFEVRPEPTDLVVLARRAAETTQAAAERHRIVLEAPESLPGEWDPRRLAQVLDNLLGNAVKYSPSGGKVRLRLERRGDEALLSVADQGVGIRPEDRPRLFELFSRLEGVGDIEGTGLGLYITRGIVEAHGGRVWAESPGPGQGSTFSVALPAST